MFRSRFAVSQEVAEPGLSRKMWFSLAGAFLVTGLMVFGPVLFSWYSSDDFIHYATVIEGGLPFVPAQPEGGFLRPIVGLSFWLDYRTWGLTPLPAHLLNIVLHIANSLLVVKFATVLQWGRPRHAAFSAMTAGFIFLILGCHAEPVSWISSRGDLLALFFTLLMLVNFCRGLQGGHLWHWAASLACLALALLSKESAFAAPLLAVLCWVHLSGYATRRSLVPLIAHLALLIAYLLFRKWMVGGFVGGYGARGHLRFHHDLIAQSLGHFSWRIFLPPLNARFWEGGPSMEGALAMAFLCALALPVFLVVLRGRSRNNPLLFCYLAFLLSLAPVINVRIYLENTEGERYLYLASAFAALGAALLFGQISHRQRRLVAVALFALFQFANLLSGVLGWREAATVARSVVTDLQGLHKEGPMILVNKPDACGGALVLRTGLPEALHYFGTQPIQHPIIDVLFAAGLSPVKHGFHLGPASGHEAGTLELATTDPGSGFSEEDRSDRIEVLQHSRNTALFRFRAPLQDAELFYYDSHVIKAVSPESGLLPSVP